MDKIGVRASRGHVRALCDLQLQVGDEVVIGVAEDWLLRSALLVYLLPLLLFFVCAGLMQWLGFAEPWVIVAGGTGLLAGWLLLRALNSRLAHDRRAHPVVLRAYLPGAAPLV